VFAGTPAFAAEALEALVAAGHEIELVLTQPDRPAGRGMKLQASAVKQVALRHGLEVLQPVSLRKGDEAEQVCARLLNPAGKGRPDAMVVAAYGLILPKQVLDAPLEGCLNIHASLLPRWRGAAPIHRAIEAGDAQTGITIMQMDEGLDTGAMCLKSSLSIDGDTTSLLHDRLAIAGATLIVQALELLKDKKLVCVAQPTDGITYAEKIRKEEAPIDWSKSNVCLANKIAAFDPFPGCLTTLPLPQGSEIVKVFEAVLLEQLDSSLVAGTVLQWGPAGLDVQCGRGILRIKTLQRAGAKRLPAELALQNLGLRTGALLS
jgi:methionyl-tRNA formyltransferase